MSKIIGNTTTTPVLRSDWAQTDPKKVDFILNKPVIGPSDWNQTDETQNDYIKNKPELGALASQDEVTKDFLSVDVQASLAKADSAIQSVDGLATEAYVNNTISQIPTPDVSGQIDAHNANSQSHSDIRQLIEDHDHNNAYDAKGTAETKTNAVQANVDIVRDTLVDHTDNTDIHVTTANKSNWNTAHTHSQATHARTDATKVADSSTNGNILINGTETNVYTHPNSGVTAGTYKSVTVNAQGHITGGTNPTTLAGYGITDAESKGAANTALASAKEYTDSVASGKSDTSHKHDTLYDAKGSADTALVSAKTYADSAATKVKNDLLNGAGGAYDTLKELGDLIVDNADAIEALETIASGKADAEHDHTISDVSGLQTALDGKAASSHGTHVSYSTTAPVMDGTASVGSASTVARSDHKHPTDTSRASKTEFDTHTSNTTSHITSTERSNWNAAKTHADSAHAPSNAEKNQNAFSNITVGSTTIAADSTTDTLTLVAGSNVTITPDATNDKITIAATDTKYTHPSTHAASMITGLATVATSGKYSDLSGTPTIPTVPTSLPANGGNADTVDNKHASDFAAASHNHSASNITSGTLPIARGGTGATDAATARTNLGLKTETWTFTLENGTTVTKAVYVG